MPRIKRSDWVGARHHVMNRGARREAIFLDDTMCASFLEIAAQLPERFGLKIHGFALMPNHFHLMLESQRGELSAGMAYLQARYSELVNRHYGWDGPLFRARFRSKLVERPEYWHYLLAYLHLNPVRAHLVMTLEQSLWTSHRAYLGKSPNLGWLTTDEMLAEIGGRAGYKRFMRRHLLHQDEAPTDFARMNLFGAERRRQSQSAADGGVAERPVLAQERSLEMSLALAAHCLNCEIPDLLERRCGRGADPRRQALIWWLVMREGVPRKAITQGFDVSPSRISQVIKAVQLRGPDSPLDLAVEALRQPKSKL